MRKLEVRSELVEETSPEGWKELIFKDRPRNLTELLDNTVRRFGDKEGFICGQERLTFRQFGALVTNVAAALQEEYGTKKGDRIALLLGNGLEFCICFFAVTRLGAIAVPLNTRHKGQELVYQINDSGSTILIMEPEFWGVIAPVKQNLEALRNIIMTGADSIEGTVPLHEIMNREIDREVKVEIDERDLACILYTSGTTGRPKGAMQFHRGLIATAMFTADVNHFDPYRDRGLCVVPLFHTTALSCIFLSSVYSCVPVVYLRDYKTRDVLKAIGEERITVFCAVITIFWLMLNHPDYDKYDLSSLRLVAYGGSPAPADAIQLLQRKLPNVTKNNGYGLTETHAFDTMVPNEDCLRKIDSVGLLSPLVNAKIVDEDGNELGPNEVGELLLKGAKVIRGYWKLPETSKETIVDGWLHTGDLAKIDEEGYVYILDRIKDMINRGGEKIFSIEVENILYQNPKVLEAAVVGVPDEVFGEQVKAVVVLKPEQSATQDEIREFCAEHLADYKVPKYVEFREALPRNPGGKVVKGVLK